MARSGAPILVVVSTLAGVLPVSDPVTYAAAGSENAPFCSVGIGRTSLHDHPVIAQAEIVESEHFVVSYHTSGQDSILRSDLPAILLEDLETAHRVLSTDPRSNMHVPFGTYDAGGRRKILVVVGATEPGYSGHARFHWPSEAVDAPCKNSADGTMIVSYRVQGRAEARRIATHELMHLFQYAMEPFESSWAKESTARWAEGFVFPQDKRIVDSWGSLIHHTTSVWNPDQQSTTYSPHFWDFLDQRWGEAIPPKFWKNACTANGLEPLQQILAERGGNLDGVLHEYALWNYYTGKRDDGAHHALGWLPEIVPDALFASYPVIDQELENYAEEGGANYVFFTGTASRQNLRIRLRGTAGWMQHRTVSWIGTTGSNTHHESTGLDSAAEEFLVRQWYQYDQVAVVVTNGPSEPALPLQELRYMVSAFEEGAPVLDVAWGPSSAPLRVSNPGRGGAAIRYRSSGAARPTQLAIYDVRGRLVRRLVDRALPAGDYGVYWDGSSETGEGASAGSYMLLLRHDAGASRGKFILLR